jgi:hypothetical protein
MAASDAIVGTAIRRCASIGRGHSHKPTEYRDEEKQFCDSLHAGFPFLTFDKWTVRLVIYCTPRLYQLQYLCAC